VSVIEILAVIGIIGYVIYCQVKGQPLRGRRTVLLPAILTVIGFVNLRSGGAHLSGADITSLVIGAAGSAVIGLAFGAVTRLESRGGYLWAQLPLRGLWLWAALVAWRVVVILLASGLHANVAASSATLLFSLGINRLAQAAVIVMRATRMGVPFAPEKNGKSFLSDSMSQRFSLEGDDSRRDFDSDFDGQRRARDDDSRQDGYRRREHRHDHHDHDRRARRGR
jgi:hypothetical protein